MTLPADSGNKPRRKGLQAGLFLHDLFQKRLPQDQEYYRPMLWRLRWLRKTWRIGLLVWYLLAIAFAGWLSFTWYQNNQAMQIGFTQSSIASAPQAVSQGDLIQLYRDLLQVQDKNRSLVVSRFGFDQSLAYETELKQRFVLLFDQSLRRQETLALRTWSENLASLADEDKQLWAGYLLGQIQLQRQAAQGKTELPASYTRLTGPFWNRQGLKAADLDIGHLFLARFRWATEADPEAPDYLRELMALLQRAAGADASWVWARPSVSAPALYLEDFWAGLAHGSSVKVPGGLTASGRSEVESFWQQLVAVVPAAQQPALNRGFWNNYWQQFFSDWQAFISEFIAQGQSLASQPGNLQHSTQVLRQNGPHWQLFTRFASEIEKLPATQNQPAWVRQWQILAVGYQQFITDQQRKTGGLADKISALGSSMAQKGQQTAGLRINLPVALQDQLADIWKNYLADLAGLSPASVRAKERVKQFGVFFRGLNQGETSGFATAYTDYRKLLDLDPDGTEATLAGRVIYAPLDFVLHLALGEAVGFLQQEWTRLVIAPLPDLNATGQLAALFANPDSPVPKFVSGVAEPYLTIESTGYRPRTFLGMQLLFREDFLAFLFEGRRTSRENLQEYPVTLVNLPLAVNPEARTRPFFSKLELQCAQKSYQLENWNYADQAVFTWIPASCSDLTLLLEFPGDLKLSRRYPGSLGFATFLEELGDGQKTYALNEFSGEVEALAQQGVQQLTLAYRLSGAAAVRSWLHRLPPTIPLQLFEKQQPMALQSPALVTLSAVAPDKPLKQLVETAHLLPQKTNHPATATEFSTAPDRIIKQNGDLFALQLMSLKSEKTLKEIWHKYSEKNLLWYSKSDSRGRWFVLISGAYPTVQGAHEALADVPAVFKKAGAYLRPYHAIQAEMDQSKTSL